MKGKKKEVVYKLRLITSRYANGQKPLILLLIFVSFVPLCDFFRKILPGNYFLKRLASAKSAAAFSVLPRERWMFPRLVYASANDGLSEIERLMSESAFSGSPLLYHALPRLCHAAA